MAKTSNHEDHHITTDDLAFSAYLKMRGYQLIGSNTIKSKKSFVFQVANDEAETLKIEFINSEFLNYYNELRNMKKIL